MPSLIDLTGKIFGRLTALEKGVRDHTAKATSATWICKCTCGNLVHILAANLKTGNTKSCGCLSRETPKNYRGGNIKDPLYTIWTSIKTRCLNPNDHNFKRYGNRGVSLPKDWVADFHVFRKEVLNTLGQRPSKNHSIDRIDANKNYTLENIRWATPAEQAHNTRKRTDKICSSKYKGVHFVRYRKWRSYITANHRRFHLGYFSTEKEVAKAYNKAALIHFKEFACLNKI